MKIAISGKGGVGKSTVAGMICHLLAQRGQKVLAVDADPDANLAVSLGLPAALRETILPISHHRELIEARTGAKVREYGQFFKLNPKVDDLAQAYGIPHGSIHLMVMGGAERGGGGCACPENVLLRALLSHLILESGESVVVDMEAGFEHLGRGTAAAIDVLLVVVEPSQTSLETAKRIQKRASDLGISTLACVGNKVEGSSDEALIKTGIGALPLLGVIPWDTGIRDCGRREQEDPLTAASPATRNQAEYLLKNIYELQKPPAP